MTLLQNKFKQSTDFYLHGIKPTIKIYTVEYLKHLIRKKIKYAVTSKEQEILRSNLNKEKIILLLKKLDQIKKLKIN